ncbi:hypothetical protein BaRGS_00014821 [Batillaria attramentaria]|uniref:Uncharacterized protein n=1 Tax=Batillaria attramentaria TaxID=370345 RepID=A0ABD0L3F6_9CAEN
MKTSSLGSWIFKSRPPPPTQKKVFAEVFLAGVDFQRVIVVEGVGGGDGVGRVGGGRGIHVTVGFDLRAHRFIKRAVQQHSVQCDGSRIVTVWSP